MQIFADETEALDWLQSLRKHAQRLDPDNPRVHEIMTDAVHYAGTLRFNEAPIDRLLIAQACGLSPADVRTLLGDETEP